MKLDARHIRHLSPQDWRVLTAVEQGSRNHELVPTQLIHSISGLSKRTPGRTSSTSAASRNSTDELSHLAKLGLIARTQNARYDGYRLTYGGLDYLALHAHVRSGSLFAVGERIGVGKEADVLVCAALVELSVGRPFDLNNEDEANMRMRNSGGMSVADALDVQSQIGGAGGRKLALKMHRLGRISFRNVKEKRDYLGRRKTGSWMYLSRLAAQKEYAVLSALFDAGFPVPTPRGWNRHTILMDLIDAGTPLRSISSVPDPAALYSDLVEIVVNLARHGLIHGDFNEFNVLISELPPSSSFSDDTTPKPIRLIPTIIDFPQAVSTSHANADEYFNRDINCLKQFFFRRFHFTPEESGPTLEEALQDPAKRRLDIEVEASGFSRKMANDLHEYIKDSVFHDENDNIDQSAQEESKDTVSLWIDGVPIEDDLSRHLSQLPEEKILEINMAKLNMANQKDDTNSVARFSTISRRTANPQKVLKGWAI